MRIPTLLAPCLAILSALACAGCGGGGYGDVGPTVYVLDLSPDAINSGFTTGGGVVSNGLTLLVGDNPNNTDVRGHLSFPFTGLPPGSTIVSATLRLSQTGLFGDPYGELGVVAAERIDQGAGLDSADHLVAALAALGTLSSNATLEVKTLDVTAATVADRIAGRPATVRLLFTGAPSVDGNEDRAVLMAINPGQELLLRVGYTIP